MSESEVSAAEDRAFVYYKRRYLIALLLGLYTATNFYQHYEFVVISDMICEYYSVSEQLVNWTALVFNVGIILFLFPTLECIEKFGFYNSMVIGTAMNALGSSIKVCAIKQNMFYLLFIGQMFPAFGSLFPLSLPAVLGTHWFKSEHVAAVIGFNFALNALGCSIAFLLPSLIYNKLSGKSEFEFALSSVSIILAAVAVAIFVMTILFVREKPETPPSFAEESRLERRTEEPSENLWRNVNFVLLTILISLISIISQAVPILLNQTIHQLFPKDLVCPIVTIAGLLVIFSEVPSSIISSVICARYKQYKAILISYCIFLVSFLCLYTFSLYILNEILIYVFLFLAGFTYYGLFVIIMDFIIEVTYPISEGISVNIAMFISAIPGLAVIPFMSFLIRQFGSFQANLTLVAIAAISLILSFCVSNDLRRYAMNFVIGVVAGRNRNYWYFRDSIVGMQDSLETRRDSRPIVF
ncbi:putative MFS-type transporter C09D4.1-like protein [Dinothrombium tinctorium]|uniref:Putative MFS-type transporter C09D4.1-like protein n=1 Tax=Dinothrombium tinctorium TaxID=1965070 RepID=A0A3S3RTT6_9ACAR|nr:putative MFS-type transporter C09D4.1-like protein [Dinothrombium tinctorium]